MPTLPTAIVTGTALDISGGNPVSFIDVILTNYAPNVPMVTGTGILFRTSQTITPAANGTFSIALFRNDQIAPAGTYYQFDFKDEQRNVIVTLFYQLTVSGTFDITSLTPYIV